MTRAGLALTFLALILSSCSGLYVEAYSTLEKRDFWQKREAEGMRIPAP